jgi:LysM repeat protein
MVSAATPSGPVHATGEFASGPVHMPANPPQMPTTTVGVSSEDPTPAVTHESHVASDTHETKKEYYTVKLTDSYPKIAHAHHITVAELKAANHIKGNMLHAGAKLIIPAPKTEVAKSEKMHDMPAGVTASTASLSASPVSATPRHHFYTVAKGDTLAYIAHKFDVTVLALKDANGVTSTKQLRVGEKLRIPATESRTTETASVRPAPAPIPVAAPAPEPPRQVETQPAPLVQPEPTPVIAPEPAPQPTPASVPELANLTF